MEQQRQRLGGIALVTGGVLSIVGYFLSGSLVRGDDHARFTNPHFLPLYAIGFVGAVLSVLGLPAILAFVGDRFPRLALVGYAGTFLALVLLNVGEGVIEAFVKPYLATHGGIPDTVGTGLDIYFLAALVCTVIGLVALGVVVLREKRFAPWVGVLLLVAAPLAFVGDALPGPFVELADYCVFVALIAIGLRSVRDDERRLPAAERERVFEPVEGRS